MTRGTLINLIFTLNKVGFVEYLTKLNQQLGPFQLLELEFN